MPKAVKKKIFKVKKKVINDDKNNFVVRFKGLSKAEERELRSDLDTFLNSYLDDPGYGRAKVEPEYEDKR